ncbi:MAG: NUDIX hydrolase [Gaiellales bacterium]
MSHVDRTLLAPVIERFGPPAVWDGSREITAADRLLIRRSTDRGRTHDVTFFILDAEELVVIRKPIFPPGAWRAPSGGVAPGESFESGTLREALEETGLAIELTGYPLVARSVFTHRGERIPWSSHVVAARTASRKLAPQDTVEIAAARWMTWLELVGPVAEVLRGTHGELFTYRAELHEQVTSLIRP